MRSIVIKGKWKSKDKILLMFWLVKSLFIVSPSRSLLPLFNDIMHCFSHIHSHYSCYSLCYFDVEYHLAPHPLYPLLRLLYSITMHWCNSHVIAQKLVFCKPVTFRFAADYFCSLLLSVFCWSCQSIALFFVVWLTSWQQQIIWLWRSWVERSKSPR